MQLKTLAFAAIAAFAFGAGQFARCVRHPYAGDRKRRRDLIALHKHSRVHLVHSCFRNGGKATVRTHIGCLGG